ncbi:MAG: flagellar basal body rod protein FlgC [candidate division Zixibacteria bacterium]|nr:flagellar basal body rod protein FlgC [candidate division Zixibacteria bacterium]MDH3937982.1 flagellar basal body rod protein FlgC [candidate division Zixibacteria bacterium]MDH4033160.1 flagellar basal body rod protein FlgC [candidate division Zixibacteria bacterium]
MAGILNAIEVSSQGLSIQRARMNTVARNIANAETTRTEEGGPYRRRRVLVEEEKVRTGFRNLIKHAGTQLSRTSKKHIPAHSNLVTRNVETPTVDFDEAVDTESNFKIVHDPSHPDADAEGYVEMPDVEIVTEMVDMMAATRAYEANTVAISAAKKMAESAMDI